MKHDKNRIVTSAELIEAGKRAADAVHPGGRNAPRTIDAKIARARKNLCGECDGELDTGWECNKCGWDGYPYIIQSDSPKGRQ